MGTLGKEEFVEWWETARPELGKVLAPASSAGKVEQDDLEQDLAYLAWIRRSHFTDFEHFRRWLMLHARWRLIDELRARSQRAHKHQIAKLQETATEPVQEHKVMFRELSKAVESLAPQQRAVIQGLLEGKSQRELAAELKVKEATVRSLGRFGRARLAAILDKGDHLK